MPLLVFTIMMNLILSWV